jgi:outer membrane lipoprotein SlyB
MRRMLMLLAVLAALTFSSCTQNPTGTSPESSNRHATVNMQDGTKTAGVVMKSSDAEITIAGDDNITRTIPMNQVRSIEYDDAVAAPEAAAPAAESSPAAAPSPAGSPAPQAVAKHSAAPKSAAAPAPVAKSSQPVSQAQTAADPTPAQPTAAPTPAPPRTLEIPAGATISVRTLEAIDSAAAAEGQVFDGEISQDVLDASGEVVIPKRSSAQIIILSASKGGKIKGASDLVLDLKSINIGGRNYNVETEDISKQGKEGLGANKRTAVYTGGGAALGAIIGAIAGGGKGAAIGAATGAGAGAVTQVLTKGKSIKVPVETVLTFRLDKMLHVTAAQ